VRPALVVRIDAHGGHVAQVNSLLAQGYQVHTKEGHALRARQLAATVSTWFADPQVSGRQVGCVNQAPDEYHSPVQRISVRPRKKNGQ